jgi:hypothetical protein
MAKASPAEHLEKIFDPFFTTQRGRGGTGLGLNIVYNLIAKRFGGTISVESTARARYDIPDTIAARRSPRTGDMHEREPFKRRCRRRIRRLADRRREPAAKKPSGPDDRPMRILIVDDEVDVHSVTRLALRNVTFKGAAAGTDERL